MAEFELGSAEAVELALCDDAGADTVRILYDGISLDANDTVLPRVLGDDPRRLILHLFCGKWKGTSALCPLTACSALTFCMQHV